MDDFNGHEEIDEKIANMEPGKLASGEMEIPDSPAPINQKTEE